MPVYLGLGAVVLLLVLMLLRAVVSTNPARLARGTQIVVTVVGIGALLVLIVFLAMERLGLALAVIAGLAPLALRFWAEWRRRQAASSPPPGQASQVETDYLQMRLDHDAGTMTGTVRRGRFQGRDLGEMSHDELVELWRECRVEDAQAAKLLEAYLDRLTPGWREASRAGANAAANSGSTMTREEAYAILGLADGAGEAEIQEAHHRLMKKIHPDRGGSTYLAAQINRARKLLLG
ncbi:DnaJ domain-containing protein [Rhizobiales bacterium GAS188]|nr:DnaJ domain-containing protein [Rhizobiales bacterium GAS188]